MANANVRKIILLLCSDPVVLAVLRDHLERAGYLVMPTGDLGTAVDRLRECKADLLITSPYVDTMTGHEAAVYLRTKCNGLPVLIVDGYMDDDRLRYRESLSNFQVFPQAFSAADFIARVRGMIGESKPIV
jgi:DNA-binding response OmpR family regulator